MHGGAAAIADRDFPADCADASGQFLRRFQALGRRRKSHDRNANRIRVGLLFVRTLRRLLVGDDCKAHPGQPVTGRQRAAGRRRRAGFSKVLIASGVGDTLAEIAKQVPVPTLVLGWLIAAAFRVATGSATTAITAAGGIVGVIVADDPEIHRELLVLSLGAGSLTLSHVNDGGFWFVKELFSLTVAQTLRTWTVLETVLSLVALVVILILNFFL